MAYDDDYEARRQAAFQYINEYQKEKYDRITVMAAKGTKELYRRAAHMAGVSLSAFVQNCVEEIIDKRYPMCKESASDDVK